MLKPIGLLAALLLFALSAHGEAIPLTVDWGGAPPARPFPVTGGVPLGRGQVTDPAQVRLIAGGVALPAQMRVLAWWPDKSVKWLLLDFQVSAAQQDLRLVYGAEPSAIAAPPAPPGAGAGGPDAAKPLTVRDDAAGVSVDTGALRFTVRRDGNGFLDELWFGAHQVGAAAAGGRWNFLDALHAANPADYPPGQRYVRNGEPDPSRLKLDRVTVEEAGPLRAVVVLDGRYTFAKLGSTITGTDVKGDCPFRLRLTAYAGQSFVKVEHFFVYEGDGDHDFVRALGLKVPLPADAASIRYVGKDGALAGTGPLSGLYQQDADAYEVWTSAGAAPAVTARGQRFEGVLDVAGRDTAVAVGIRAFWQSAAKALHADLKAHEAGLLFWPPEAPPLDFRRHAREWSVGETGEPDDKDGTTPMPFARPNYRLASKGVGKTHEALVYLHDPAAKAEDVLAVYRRFEHRPLLWAPPHHYAASLALGAYREKVAGEHDDIEAALDRPIRYWRFNQDYFRWYGFWLYGNVCQSRNQFLQTGRWEQDFGRWGWANGDSVGRLSYALMLQALRRADRADFEFAQEYLYNVHDVCSIHSAAYPEHYGTFQYFKGAAHRHGAWPWACPYTGIRGAHPVGAKIHYFLTGAGHTRDILDEVTQLVLKRPDGGMGDGPLGPNAQIFLYQWETTGQDIWRQRLRDELAKSKMGDAKTGWDVMMFAAFGNYNALEEYVQLTGDRAFDGLARQFADAALPEKMKNHWTWGGYYRVYAAAYALTGDAKYRAAVEEMLPVLKDHSLQSVEAKLPEKDWPGPAGSAQFFIDGNIIRDIPFALHALHAEPRKEGR